MLHTINDNHPHQENLKVNLKRPIRRQRATDSIEASNPKQIIIYITSTFVITLTIFNVYLIYWIVASLHDRTTLGQTDSYINLMREGLQLHGQSVFNQDIVVSQIRSKFKPVRRKRMNSRNDETIREDASMHFNSDANITFLNGQQQISLTSSGVIDLGRNLNQMTIVSSSKSKVTINSSNLLIGADKLIVTNNAGLDVKEHSIQTRRLYSDDNFSLHSPTQKLRLLTPKRLHMDASNGSFDIEASERISIRSQRGSVIFDCPLVDITNLRSITPSQSGRAYPNLYKLCYCHLSSQSQSQSQSQNTHYNHSGGWKKEQFKSGGLPHPRMGLLFGVKPSLNCSSFNWFCNSAPV